MAMLLNLKNSSDKDFVKTWTTKYIQVEEGEEAQVVVSAQEVEVVKVVIEETVMIEVMVLVEDQIKYRV